jgi:hypothetical protein
MFFLKKYRLVSWSFLPVLSLLFFLEGCSFAFNVGSAPEISGSKVENTIETVLLKGTTILKKSIVCPKKIIIKINTVFQCKVESDIGVIVVEGKFKDQEGGYVVKSKNFIIFSLVEEKIKSGLQEVYDIKVSLVKCDYKDKLTKPGDTFQCKVTNLKGKTDTVIVTLENEYGDWNWKGI